MTSVLLKRNLDGNFLGDHFGQSRPKKTRVPGFGHILGGVKRKLL